MRTLLFAFFASVATSGCHLGFLGVVVGTGASGPYQAETIAKELGPASVRTLGCLDVGFVPFERGEHELVDLHVGNRCGHPEQLDLRRLAIRAYDSQSQEHDVALHDPRDEIASFHVGGSDRGYERIRLETPPGHVVVRLCFEVERIAPDAPESRAARMCFRRANARWSAAEAPS
jgi:hypothetical protein